MNESIIEYAQREFTVLERCEFDFWEAVGEEAWSKIDSWELNDFKKIIPTTYVISQ